MEQPSVRNGGRRYPAAERALTVVMHDLELGHPVFDADNHYYEALDAFTRHLDPALGPRCVQWCEIDGRRYHVLGGRVSQAVTNPTFDPIAKPGAMHDYFRGQPRRHATRSSSSATASRSAPSTATATRGSRCSTSRASTACWLFPTLGMIYEELAQGRSGGGLPSRSARSTGGSHEDWGFDLPRTASSPRPYLSLADAGLGRRASSSGRSTTAPAPIVMRPAAPTTDVGQLRPSDDACSIRSGRASTRPASPSSCTPATVASRRNGYAGRRLRRHLRGGGVGAVDQDVRTSSGRSTTS